MKIPSQEDLLGYVLGALDAQEHRNVQQSIDDNPEVEEQLLQIKSALLPLDCLETSGPAPGLARRTCETVAGWQNEQRPDFADASDLPGISGTRDAAIRAALVEEAPATGSVGLRRTVSDRILHPTTWSIPDVLVGMALIAVTAGLLFPAISYSRYNSRVVDCQSNLRELGIALMSYSSANEGQFICIPREGNLAAVGCIGPILKDASFITDDSVLSCAGVASTLPPVHIPSCKQVTQATCESEIDHYRKTMFGHYGFSMGHRIGDRYYSPRNMGRSNVVLVADRPSAGLPGRMSGNHSQFGQNCLFEDGHVGFVKGPAYGGDPLFENDYGVVGPGSHATDNVVAPSHLSPTPEKGLIKVIQSDVR